MRCHSSSGQWHCAALAGVAALWDRWVHGSGRPGAPRRAWKARHVVANQHTVGRHWQARPARNHAVRGLDWSREATRVGGGGILAEVGAPDTWAVRERERESEEALGWAMAASRVGSLTGR
jgi:hypothetical protein